MLAGWLAAVNWLHENLHIRRATTCSERLPYSTAAMARLALLLLAAAGPLALAACGGSGPATTKPPVRLTVEAPSDGAVVRQGRVEVSGRVSPAGATVLVRGQVASVAGATFSAQVPLDSGDNVIDVMATAPATRPTMTAVRIVRDVTIRVPDVTGGSSGDARNRLASAGLRADVHESSNPFQDLLPLDASVCSTDPSPGARVERGTTVRVRVAKIC
jgi:Glucodextranase, domain B/PASTA domain